MTAAVFRLEAMGAHHVHVGFGGGVVGLDVCFAREATQDLRRRASVCFVAVERQSCKVAGYCNMAAGGVLLTDLPDALIKRLPRYPSVPVARVGRLAVDLAYRGKKLGGALFVDAAI